MPFLLQVPWQGKVYRLVFAPSKGSRRGGSTVSPVKPRIRRAAPARRQTPPSIDLAVTKLSSSELQHESGLRLEIAEPRCGGRL